MAKTLYWAPERVVVGPSASNSTSPELTRLGQRVFILGGERALVAARRVVASLQDSVREVQVHVFGGECSAGAIERAQRAATGAGFILGIGGGKAIDTAKAVADALCVPCATIPTSPATCAAYTPLSILHDEKGAYVESRRLRRPVSLLVLDPDLMADCPPRLLTAGMLDTYARLTDATLAARVARPPFAAATSLAVAQACVGEALLPDGLAALADHAAGTLTASVERVVEACVLGAGLAGETGSRFFGRGLSHAVAYGLGALPEAREILHGEAVGMGILVQALLDPAPAASFASVAALWRSWGAPTSFASLGVTVSERGTRRALADKTLAYLDGVRAVPFDVAASDLETAFLAVDTATGA